MQGGHWEHGTWRDQFSQSAGSQICVFVLEFPIQGQASLFSVVGQKGSQCVDLAERRTGSHRVTGK